jgi:hypothetical protein
VHNLASQFEPRVLHFMRACVMQESSDQLLLEGCVRYSCPRHNIILCKGKIFEILIRQQVKGKFWFEVCNGVEVCDIYKWLKSELPIPDDIWAKPQRSSDGRCVPCYSFIQAEQSIVWSLISSLPSLRLRMQTRASRTRAGSISLGVGFLNFIFS